MSTKPKTKPRKPRRVVLGEGYAHMTVTWPAVELTRHGGYYVALQGRKIIEGKHIRLVAEVLRKDEPR